MLWVFKDFVNERGENEIRQWLDKQPKPIRIKIDTRIRYLQAVEQLKYPYVEKWVGEDDIYEVRIDSSGVAYRILGCYGPDRGDFTLLICGVEKGGRLEPRHAVRTAKRRMTMIRDGKYVCKHFGQD